MYQDPTTSLEQWPGEPTPIFILRGDRTVIATNRVVLESCHTSSVRVGPPNSSRRSLLRQQGRSDRKHGAWRALSTKKTPQPEPHRSEHDERDQANGKNAERFWKVTAQDDRRRDDEQRGAHAPQVPPESRRALKSAHANHPAVAFAREQRDRAKDEERHRRAPVRRPPGGEDYHALDDAPASQGQRGHCGAPVYFAHAGG